MEIQFRTRKLRRQYEEYEEARKAYGQQVARKYIQRVSIIRQAKDIDELMGLPGLRCHPLKGKRKGQYAVKLTRFFRLIFTLEGDRLEIAMIEEVSKHYDDSSRYPFGPSDSAGRVPRGSGRGTGDDQG